MNTASQCGFTPQYEGLVELDEDYREQGLVILGFLSNDFGNQGGSDEEVERCNRDFRVTSNSLVRWGLRQIRKRDNILRLNGSLRSRA